MPPPAPARVHVREDLEGLWAALAQAWRSAAEEAVSERGRFTAALSGGRTPAGFYAVLARQPGLPWSRTDLFMVDERLVPAGSPESNARLIGQSLLAGLAAPPAATHFVRTELSDAAAAAADYEGELLRVFSSFGVADPVFDLVLLGIGPDGHTASLFPGSAALEERSRLVAGVPAEGARLPRVTLTLPLINAARRVAFLVTGPEKSPALRRVLSGDRRLPAARVQPAAGRVEFFLDRAAAADI